MGWVEVVLCAGSWDAAWELGSSITIALPSSHTIPDDALDALQCAGWHMVPTQFTNPIPMLHPNSHNTHKAPRHLDDPKLADDAIRQKIF